MSEPAHALAARIQSLATRMLRLARRNQSDGGIGSAQYSAMAVLHTDAPLSLVELARRERVSHPTMSRVVDSLVRQGLAVRLPNPADRRSRLLALTEEGRVLYERISAARIQITAAVLTLLKPETVEEIAAALTNVAARLERD